MRERIEHRHPVDQLGAAFAQPPQRIERGGEEEHRKHHEIHRAREVLDLPDIHRQEQPERAQHQPGHDQGRQYCEPGERLEGDVERDADQEKGVAGDDG